DLRELHSFATRRSSDLPVARQTTRRGQSVSLKNAQKCAQIGVPRAQVTPSWSSSDYQERSVSQSEKRSKVRSNRGAQSPGDPLLELVRLPGEVSQSV